MNKNQCEDRPMKKRGRKPKTGDMSRVFRNFADGRSSEKIGCRARRQRGSPLKEQQFVITDSVVRVFYDTCFATAAQTPADLDCDASSPEEVAADAVNAILLFYELESVVESFSMSFEFTGEDTALSLSLTLRDSFLCENAARDESGSAKGGEMTEQQLRSKIKRSVIDGMFSVICCHASTESGDKRGAEGQGEERKFIIDDTQVEQSIGNDDDEQPSGLRSP